MKSTERKFGAFLIPSVFMPLDRFGNVRGAEYTRLLSNLGLLTDQASNASGSRKSLAARSKVEYIRKGDTIYRKTGPGKGRILPAFLLTRNAPRYSRRYHFYRIADDVIARSSRPYFEKALNDAIAASGFRGGWRGEGG